MHGFVDLHCHWIAGIDDGARTPEEGVAMLLGLYEAGFSHVTATPHMRPDMFNNDAAELRRAYAAMTPYLTDAGPVIPTTDLASEHFFDSVVFERLMKSEGLPYPPLAPLASLVGTTTHGAATEGGIVSNVASARRLRPLLIEFPPQAFPARAAARMFDLKRVGLRPVLAHPERYRPVWSDDGCLDPLLDAGVVLLLDVCALVGKYGKASQGAAEKLLEEDSYEAACSDAHRPEDAETVARAIERLEALVGLQERNRLLRDGPRGILA
jgi:protein-tyrosine phosphatase